MAHDPKDQTIGQGRLCTLFMAASPPPRTIPHIQNPKIPSKNTRQESYRSEAGRFRKDGLATEAALCEREQDRVGEKQPTILDRRSGNTDHPGQFRAHLGLPSDQQRHLHVSRPIKDALVRIHVALALGQAVLRENQDALSVY